MSDKKVIAVIGATGAQGGGLARAILEDKDGLLNAAVIGNQNLVIHLKKSNIADGIYGFTKKFDRVAVTADEPAKLMAVLRPDATSGSRVNR